MECLSVSRLREKGLFNVLKCFLYIFQIGFTLTEEQLEEAAVTSGVLEYNNDFLEPAFRRDCVCIIPNPEEIEPKNCAAAYMYLKSVFRT